MERIGAYLIAVWLALAGVAAAAVEPDAQALFDSGAWDKLVEAAGSASDPKVLALAGEAHLRRGRHDEALAVLAKGGADRWCQALAGLVHRARGKKAEADQLFTALREQIDPETKVVRELWALSVAQRELNAFQAALDALARAQELAPDDARSRVMCGDLFVTKYQVHDAMKELDAALDKHPEDPLALAAKAHMEAEYSRLEDARVTAEKALKACPQLVEPHLTRAVIHEYDEAYDEMLAAVEAARALNPKSADVLAKLAVARWLRNEKDAFAQAEKDCLAVKPDHARLYLDLGESCAARRRVDEAEAFFKKALAMDPELSDAESALGNLYMREGQEEQARVHLERAWERDQFNYRTKNFLELLDYMDRKFMVRLSEHFIFKVDEEKEGYLADVFLPEMDRMYPDLLKRYRFAPKERVIVELFPANDWFAARISGTPWIGITGGCFGRVIAAESPVVTPGLSHRSEVLLHEITHAINLQQTRRKIPMWLAEGLATQQERSHGGPTWPSLLKRGLGVGDLLPLSNLNSGFTRAKNMAQRQLAYYQASLVVAELKKRFGFDKVLALLDAFNAGKTQAQAFSEVVGLDPAAMDALAMDAWKAAAAASPRRAVYGESDLEALKKKADAGGDAERAQYLVGLVDCGRAVEAVAVVKQLATAAKSDASIAALVGDFLLSRKNTEKAASYYDLALKLDAKCYTALIGKGKLAYVSGDLRGAAAQLDAAAAAHPLETEPHAVLRKIHKQLKDADRELAEIRALAQLELHVAEPWMDLAKALVERKDWKGAREALTELISIDTTNPELFALRAQVAEGLSEKDAALEAWTLHWRLSCYPYKPKSKTGDGLDAVQAAVKGAGDARELGAVMAAGTIGTKGAADWLASLSGKGGEVAHRAGLALAAAQDARAFAPLVGALGCGGAGACGARALEALRRLTGRGFASPSEWNTWAQSRATKPREDWVLESLEAAGYKAPWGEADEEIPVLISALEAKDWWVRETAWRELVRSSKFAYGRGAFGPVPPEREADYASVRAEAVARFKAWWERYKARN
jgi:tetratricopeptide (TPR) repeat protein